MRYFVLLLSIYAVVVPADEDRVFIANTLKSPPYIYEDNGQLIGSAISLVDEMFKRAGNYRVHYVPLPWKRALMKTMSGEADMLFYAARSDSRKAWGLYVNSVLINTRFVLFKLSSAEIALKPDFSNGGDYRLAVRRGYIYRGSEFIDAIQNNGFRAVVESGSTAQSIELLKRGRVDFFIGDYMPVMHYINSHGLQGQLDTVSYNNQTIEVFQVPTYLLLSKKNVSSELQRRLYNALESMKRDGTYSRLVVDQSNIE